MHPRARIAKRPRMHQGIVQRIQGFEGGQQRTTLRAEQASLQSTWLRSVPPSKCRIKTRQRRRQQADHGDKAGLVKAHVQPCLTLGAPRPLATAFIKGKTPSDVARRRRLLRRRPIGTSLRMLRAAPRRQALGTRDHSHTRLLRGLRNQEPGRHLHPSHQALYRLQPLLRAMRGPKSLLLNTTSGHQKRSATQPPATTFGIMRLGQESIGTSRELAQRRSLSVFLGARVDTRMARC